MNGTELKNKRLAKGYPQGELAKLVGVRREYLNSVENGKSTPSLALLTRIAKELDCSVKDFF